MLRQHLVGIITASILLQVSAIACGDEKTSASSEVGAQCGSSDFSLRTDEVRLKHEELQLKHQELRFKEEESRFKRNSDFMNTIITAMSVIVASAGVAVPLYLGMKTLSDQRKMADDQAANQLKLSNEQSKLQFQMKAAELVLKDSINATQATERARILSALFTGRLPNKFAEQIDASMFRLDAGSSRNNRLELLKLVTQYPQARDRVLRDWYILFSGDWWFVEPLLQHLSSDEWAHVRMLRNLLRENDAKITSKEKEVLSAGVYKVEGGVSTETDHSTTTAS